MLAMVFFRAWSLPCTIIMATVGTGIVIANIALLVAQPTWRAWSLLIGMGIPLIADNPRAWINGVRENPLHQKLLLSANG